MLKRSAEGCRHSGQAWSFSAYQRPQLCIPAQQPRQLHHAIISVSQEQHVSCVVLVPVKKETLMRPLVRDTCLLAVDEQPRAVWTNVICIAEVHSQAKLR